MLTEGSARDIGAKLRFIRHARQMTLRDVAKRALLSPQYIQNIEHGARRTVSFEVYERLARAYGMDDDLLRNLLFRAEFLTALEHRGVPESGASSAWAGIVGVLSAQGIHVEPDVAEFIGKVL